jgi:hypothetical protein
MHQNKRVESVRTQIKGHRFHSKQSRFVVGRTPLDDLSLGEIRLLTPGAAFAT